MSNFEAGLFSYLTQCFSVEPRAWHKEGVHESLLKDWKAQLGGVSLSLDWPGPHHLYSLIPIISVS